METELFDNLLESVKQAIDYEKGDTAKARSVFTEVSDDDIDQSYLIYQKVVKMTETNRQRVAGYVDGLLQASG